MKFSYHFVLLSICTTKRPLKQVKVMCLNFYVWLVLLTTVFIITSEYFNVLFQCYPVNVLKTKFIDIRFSTPDETDPEAHPASYTEGIGSFPGYSGRGLMPSSAQVKERGELHLWFPSGPSWPAIGWILASFIHQFQSIPNRERNLFQWE